MYCEKACGTRKTARRSTPILLRYIEKKINAPKITDSALTLLRVKKCIFIIMNILHNLLRLNRVPASLLPLLLLLLLPLLTGCDQRSAADTSLTQSNTAQSAVQSQDPGT